MAETVKSLTEKVAAGTIDAKAAGEKMRPLVTRAKVITTLKQRQESYNSAAYETDPNAFVHVSAMYSIGQISREDYDTIYAQVMS